MEVDSTSVFNFMSLRAIRQPDVGKFKQALIRDDAILPSSQRKSSSRGRRVDVDLFSPVSPSLLCKTIFELVNQGVSIASIVQEVERLLLRGYDGALGAVGRKINPVIIRAAITAKSGSLLTDLSGRPYYLKNGAIYLMPATLANIDAPISMPLIALRSELEKLLDQIKQGRKSKEQAPEFRGFDLAHDKRLGYPEIIDWVFSLDTGGYNTNFAIAKRFCFDSLYGLYVLRKLLPVRLEPAIEALQVLHTMERSALYLFFRYAGLAQDDAAAKAKISKLAATLGDIYPEYVRKTADASTMEAEFDQLALPFRATDDPSESPFNAQPVIHPLFSRLSRTFVPFNDLKPVGIGDLMVVKQTFLGYRKGEIAHIETVLAGETKSTVHRRLDKSEVSQTYVSNEETENIIDRQSTTRYELKREAESVIKTDFSASLGAQLSYDNKIIVSSVTASANLALGRSDTSRLASNFARDVTEKAVTKVQRRVSEQRTRSITAETEETNRHDFINPAANGNISGIYRWIDKVYQAEVRNYGRRLMFELIVPEPAAFFVQQRLLEYVAKLDLPDFPKKEVVNTSNTGHIPPVANAAMITRDKFTELNQTYMLDDMLPPAQSIDGIDVIDGSGNRTFTMGSDYYSWGIKPDTFNGCRFAQIPAGYALKDFAVKGSLDFAGSGESNPNWQNMLRVKLDNSTVFDKVDESIMGWRFDEPSRQTPPNGVPAGFMTLTIETKTCKMYNLSFSASAELSAAAFTAWQGLVFSSLTAARLRKTDTGGAPVADPDITEFIRALKDIKKPDTATLLQGRSSDWNANVIKRELRRQCISQVTKEFGADSRTLDITNTNSMGTLGVGRGFEFPDLSVSPGTQTASETTAKFEQSVFPISGYAVPDIDIARRKGNHIQFIEHAFEWEHLSYVFYPYYWSTPPKWVSLLSREDDADSAFTEFLQAGAARVLLAVRPGFENAVMHYLATRELWEGGSAPVIGDPMHLPVHMEIRGRQDDFANSERVGDPWIVTIPTSLVYLESANYQLPNEYDQNAPVP